MPQIAVVTDSTCDLPAALCAEYEIVVVPHLVHFGDEVFRDGVDLTNRRFFERLSTAALRPETTSPNSAAFELAFRQLVENHDQILAVTISSKLSGAYSAAGTAAATVGRSGQIEVVDSFNTSLGLGFQVLRAVELRDRGFNIAEIAARLRTNVDAYHLVFFADTLDYLQQGGRVGRSTSLVSTLLHLKPLLRVDEGQIVPFERARTKSRAIAQLEDFVATWPAEIERLGVLYTDNRDSANRLTSDLARFRTRRPMMVAPLGPVLGAHVGPGAMGICLAEPDLR